MTHTTPETKLGRSTLARGYRHPVIYGLTLAYSGFFTLNVILLTYFLAAYS